jgi:PelA/Pel-15E family pectate lyase
LTRITVRLLEVGFCLAVLGFCVPTVTLAQPGPSRSVTWTNILKQESDWYGNTEAVRIANNVLMYQRDSGGWPKNIDMAKLLTAADAAALVKQKQAIDSTIDNGASYTQLIFLARVFAAKKFDRYKRAFLKGVDYLLDAQYANGGWPQYFPSPQGYYGHITFNDGAMIGVLKLLQDVVQNRPPYSFVDDRRRIRAGQAVQRGLEVILKTQVLVKNQRTIWGAQHDPVTLAPAPARTFEPVSLASAESVGIVRFLMSLDQPTRQVVDAIQSAVKWFETAKISGIRWVQTADAAKPGRFERVVMRDSSAGPLWARFYEIETNRPVFAGRDGVIKYDVQEIEVERRNGYRWYVDDPNELLNKDYPAWLKQWRPVAGSREP